MNTFISPFLSLLLLSFPKNRDRPELDPLIYFPPDATLNTSLGPSSLPSSLPASGPSCLPIGTIETYTHRLRSLYCGGVGFEYSHLDEGREREWLRERSGRGGGREGGREGYTPASHVVLWWGRV